MNFLSVLESCDTDDNALVFDFEPSSELDSDYCWVEASSSETSGSESEIDNDQNRHLQIIEFVRSANLDKTNTDRLLDLLNSIHSNVDLPKSARELWEKAGVKFSYKRTVYCTKCKRQLSKYSDKCNCDNAKKNMNTELVLFSIPDEIRRVVKKNINLIEFFHAHKDEFVYDVTNGKLDLFHSLCLNQMNSILGTIYRNRVTKNPITLLLGTDGKPTFKSSGSSVWPVSISL